MGETSGISWTDGTFNPLIGCAKVSEACRHCYAETFARVRLGAPELWRGERRPTAIGTWGVVRRLQREAEKDGRRRRLFCASLADIAEDHPAWDAPAPAGYPFGASRSLRPRITCSTT